MVRLILRVLIFLVSGFAIAGFAYSAVHYVYDPRTPDPMERALVEHSQRVTHREALYTEPATSDEPALMPGYPSVVSFLAVEREPRLKHVRAVAVGAALLTAFLVAALIRMECSSWTLAVASAGFVLIGQGFLPESWSARPESLMLPIVLIGLSLIRFTDGVWGALFGAIPLTAAYFVDQQAAWFVGAAYFSVAFEHRNRLAAFAVMTGLVFVGGYVALSILLGPWFNFSAWDQPTSLLRFNGMAALRFVTDHLLGTLQIWTLAALLAHAMPTQPWQGKTGIWMCVGVAAVMAGIFSTQSTAFGLYSLVPGVVLLSLLGPVIVQRIARHLSAWSDPDLPGGEGVILAALLLQFFTIVSAIPMDRWLPSLVGLWHSMV